MAQTSCFEIPYKVCPELIEQYRRNGFILIKKIFQEEELAPVRDRISALMADYSQKRPPLKDRSTYGRAFLQKANLWREDPLIKQFVLSQRCAGIAAQLSGEAPLRLYHDQALFKEAGGGLTPWHQDQVYWPLDTVNALTMWMPLDSVNRDDGLMKYLQGSHRGKALSDLTISDESQRFFGQYTETRASHIWQARQLEAGDAVFHNGWTLHAADANISDSLRRIMTVIYYPDGTRLLKEESETVTKDRLAFFPEAKPGEMARGGLTPLIPLPDTE